jgi:hypothetical protein
MPMGMQHLFMSATIKKGFQVTHSLRGQHYLQWAADDPFSLREENTVHCLRQAVASQVLSAG